MARSLPQAYTSERAASHASHYRSSQTDTTSRSAGGADAEQWDLSQLSGEELTAELAAARNRLLYESALPPPPAIPPAMPPPPPGRSIVPPVPPCGVVVGRQQMADPGSHLPVPLPLPGSWVRARMGHPPEGYDGLDKRAPNYFQHQWVPPDLGPAIASSTGTAVPAEPAAPAEPVVRAEPAPQLADKAVPSHEVQRVSAATAGEELEGGVAAKVAELSVALRSRPDLWPLYEEPSHASAAAAATATTATAATAATATAAAAATAATAATAAATAAAAAAATAAVETGAEVGVEAAVATAAGRGEEACAAARREQELLSVLSQSVRCIRELHTLVDQARLLHAAPDYGKTAHIPTG